MTENNWTPRPDRNPRLVTVPTVFASTYYRVPPRRELRWWQRPKQ